MRWFLTSDIGKYLYILAITRCKLLLQLFLCYSSPAFNTTASLLKCIGTKAVFLKIFIFVVLTRSGDSSWINQGFIWFVSYSALISVRKSSWFLQNSPKSQNWQCMWAFIAVSWQMSQFSTPEGLERHHVRDVYDNIAPYFVGSRHKAWPRVEQFLLSLPAGSLIADVGEL